MPMPEPGLISRSKVENIPVVVACWLVRTALVWYFPRWSTPANGQSSRFGVLWLDFQPNNVLQVFRKYSHSLGPEAQQFLEEILDVHEIKDEDVEYSIETIAREYNKQDGGFVFSVWKAYPQTVRRCCHESLAWHPTTGIWNPSRSGVGRCNWDGAAWPRKPPIRHKCLWDASVELVVWTWYIWKVRFHAFITLAYRPHSKGPRSHQPSPEPQNHEYMPPETGSLSSSRAFYATNIFPLLPSLLVIESISWRYEASSFVVWTST